MFTTNAIKVQKSQRLKTKDVKLFRNTIKNTFPHLQEEQINVICPIKSYVDCITLKNKDVIYSINVLGKKGPSEPMVPYFYRKNKEFMPTIFLL